MNIHIMTLFPEMVMGGLNTSITGRAISKGILSIEAVNIRDYAFNKHNSVDDYPYGGGAGMLMQAEPVYQCYQAIIDKIHTQGGADSELCVEKKEAQGAVHVTTGSDIYAGDGGRACAGRGTDLFMWTL